MGDVGVAVVPRLGVQRLVNGRPIMDVKPWDILKHPLTVSSKRWQHIVLVLSSTTPIVRGARLLTRGSPIHALLIGCAGCIYEWAGPMARDTSVHHSLE